MRCIALIGPVRLRGSYVGRPGRAARPAKRLPEKILDLGVQAAQVVVCPALNALEHGRVDANQEGFPVRHGVPVLLMDGAGVQDRLRAPLATQHDQEIADHRRLALLVEVDDGLL